MDLGRGFHPLLLAALLATGPAMAGDRSVAMRGINLSGAEFAANILPGVANKDYVYPTAQDIARFAALGMNTIRLPFLWERLQPRLGAPFDAAELARIKAVVKDAAARRITVILDPHDYGGYRGQLIGSDDVPVSAFQDFWTMLATSFKASPNVAFGLMNEPVKQDADEWARIAQGTIDAIRGTGARQLILVPGTNWTGAHSWGRRVGSLSNAEALADVHDPADNMAIEVHQYFDGNASGTKPDCVSATVGADALAGFTKWLRDTHHRGFLGEFGASKDATCLAALDGTLAALTHDSDVWLGWTYWVAGDWFGDYMFNVMPPDPAKHPQVSVLMKYLGPGMPATQYQ